MNEKNDSGINKGNKPVITNVESGEIQLDKPDTIDQQFLRVSGGTPGNLVSGASDGLAGGVTSNPSNDIAKGVRTPKASNLQSGNNENNTSGDSNSDIVKKDNIPRKNGGYNPATGIATPNNQDNSDNKDAQNNSKSNASEIKNNSKADQNGNNTNNSALSRISNRLTNSSPISKVRNGLSKIGLGKKEGLTKKDDSKDDNSKEGKNESSNGVANINNLETAGTLFGKFKISFAALSIFVFLLVLLFFVILLSVLLAVFENDENNCDGLTYDASNATEFLCNMRSPFGSDAEGKEYIVTSTSGKRIPPGEGASNFHEGTDIGGVNGISVSSVYAVADGKVESAEYSGGYGNQVLIKHELASGTFYTRYAHLSSINVSANSDVKAGDKIGIWGNTGTSYGTHLHFELRDESKNYLSANPFFGYSDQGYGDCLKENSSIANSKCDFDYSGKARYIGQDGFNQICGKTGSYVSNLSNQCCGTLTASNSGNIASFISVFEGTGDRCTASDGSNGYVVYADANAGGRLTVGPGVTSNYIDNMKVGQCLSQSTVLKGYEKAEKSKRNMIQTTFADANLTKYQEDAMVSMAYNGCGGFFTNIAKAAKEDNLSEVWKAMKDCVHGDGTGVLLGLQRRRKAEFALFVTGDYSEQTAKKYKEKTWNNIEYNDYDSDGVIAKKASGSSSTCSSADSTGNKVIDIAIKELSSWNGYNEEGQYCGAIKKYMNSCGLEETVNEYCAGFVTYVLKEAGVFDSIGLPSATCSVDAFKNPTNGKVYDAGGSYTPKPGDLFVKKDDKGNDWGHIGIVEKVVGKTIHTIEGNTDPFNALCGQGDKTDSGRKGDGTLRRKTHIDDITHFISY